MATEYRDIYKREGTLAAIMTATHERLRFYSTDLFNAEDSGAMGYLDDAYVSEPDNSITSRHFVFTLDNDLNPQMPIGENGIHFRHSSSPTDQDLDLILVDRLPDTKSNWPKIWWDYSETAFVIGTSSINADLILNGKLGIGTDPTSYYIHIKTEADILESVFEAETSSGDPSIIMNIDGDGDAGFYLYDGSQVVKVALSSGGTSYLRGGDTYFSSDVFLDSGVDHTIGVTQAATDANGDDLTIQAGKVGPGIGSTGGTLYLKSGEANDSIFCTGPIEAQGDYFRFDVEGVGDYKALINNVGMELSYADSGTYASPVFTLFKNNIIDQADNDYIGEMHFDGTNDEAEQTIYCLIGSQMIHVEDGVEDGSLFFQTIKLGSLTTALTMDENSHVKMGAGLFQGFKGSDLASANDMAVPGGNYCDVTGTTQINTMAVTSIQAGTTVTLQFDGSVTVKNNTAGAGAVFYLAGGDFSAIQNNTLTVVYDGVAWREAARAVI